MSVDEDELLAKALGAVGARGGGIFGGRAGARGGWAGAELAARRLRKNVLELELVVSLTPEQAAGLARDVLADQGSLVRAGQPGEDSAIEVVGIVGAGLWNLNPAVVTITIRSAATGSQIVVRGAAKEGLIKQRSGESAARRVAATISR